ncbi:MAG: acyltransferase [Hahellaceae bacterium]|jgi:acetyltransferase-like isoleucine patch superfamily enzyme|nr:acyltransferase [Hahellaceae bacterium]
MSTNQSNKTLAAVEGGAIRKYQILVVGNTRLGYLIKFELITLLCGWVPGALGLALRRIFYPRLFKSVGKGVVFGANLTLRHPEKISLGDNVVLDDNCLIDAKGESNRGITIGNDVFVGRNTILSCKNGDIILEDRVNIGFNSEIFSSGTVRLGADTLIAAYVYIVGGEGYDLRLTDLPIAKQPVYDYGTSVTIGAGAWIGAKAVILNNLTLGQGCVVGAGAVVTRAVPDNTIVGGIPAKVLGERKP